MTTNSHQDHTASYYAATANKQTVYEQLNGHKKTDVCVIGAGFTGISTALHLAERGYKVHVLEANKVGWGASGRNGGQMIGGISGESRLSRDLSKINEKIVFEMGWQGHKIIRDRVKKYNIKCDLKNGYIDVAIKPKHVRDLENYSKVLDEYNFDFGQELLNRDEVRETLGTEKYIGGLKINYNGHLHPLNLCIGEADAASDLGVVINEKSPVTKIIHGAKPVVETSQGSVEADFVVLAGNAYHFLEPKLRGAVLPVKSFIIGSEPLSTELVNRINPQDLAVCDPNYILEYFRLSADKRLLFGRRFPYFGDNPDIIKKALIPKMLQVYPILKNTEFEFGWGGTIGVTVNRVPQLGRISDNVFYSQGYSGHGVNVTHLAGQIMADIVGGTAERFDVFSKIKPVIFPGQHLFRNQLVSLGMLYYRLIDAL